MRKVLTLLASLAAILGTPSIAAAQTQTVTVTQFSCDSVTVEGAGWEQTEATVEIAIPPSEGGEGREDFVAGPIQVFPDTQGNIPATTLQFTNPPPDGHYVGVVLVDSIARDQSAGFALAGCTEKTLPRTGSLTIPMLATGLVLAAIGFGLVRRTRTN
jgi:LPXTG-motif cell wall-anchored protein